MQKSDRPWNWRVKNTRQDVPAATTYRIQNQNNLLNKQKEVHTQWYNTDHFHTKLNKIK